MKFNIGDFVRYIGGQDKEGIRLYRLKRNKSYQVDVCNPEILGRRGLTNCIGLKDIYQFPGVHFMFREDMFIPITNNKLVTMSEENNEKKGPVDDQVNHPSHYTSGKIEVIDFILDQKLGFDLGNAVKYIARAGKKDPTKEVQDLEKAAWYLNHHINILKNKRYEKDIEELVDFSNKETFDRVKEALSTNLPRIIGKYADGSYITTDDDVVIAYNTGTGLYLEHYKGEVNHFVAYSNMKYFRNLQDMEDYKNQL